MNDAGTFHIYTSVHHLSAVLLGSPLLVIIVSTCHYSTLAAAASPRSAVFLTVQ